LVLEGSGYTYSTKPKKSLGQHYLKDEKILRKIVRSLRLTGNEIVLEIGAGHGELTYYLAQQSRELYAVEIDSSSVIPFKGKIRAFSQC